MSDESEGAGAVGGDAPESAPGGSPSAGGLPDATAAEILAELKALRREVAELRREVRLGGRRPGTPFGPVNPPPAAPAPRLRRPSAPRIPRVPGMERAVGRARARAGTVRTTVAGWRQGREWAPAHPLRWDLAAILVIGVAAWLLRYVDVATIPQGLHGDEAATGLEARRILDDGSIGVYTGAAGGNPTGFYYLAALIVARVSDPVLAVRLVSVIGGTLGVVALYVLARRNLGLGSAVVGATLLAFSEWHIQFSRVGFVTGIWPTCVLLGTIALMEALRTASWRWWAAAGALLTVPIYIYNGHGPVMLILAVFILGALFGWTAVAAAACLAVAWLAGWPGALPLALAAVALLVLTPRLRERGRLINAGAFGAASLAVAWKLLGFIRARPHEYFGRGEQLSVFRTDAWRARSGLLDHAAFLAGRYRDFWDQLSFHPRTNGVDLTGITTPVPELTLLLCLAGLALALARRPNPLVVLAALVVVAAPLTAVATDLTLRRSLVIAPFLALLGGVGAVEVVRIASRRGRSQAVVVGLAVAGLIAISSRENYVGFFDETVDAGPVQQTFATELREASDFMATLPPDAYVEFFSDRWVLDYDVVRLIAPDVHGENRSTVWGGSGTYEVDRSKGAPVFVLMGGHVAELARIQAMYPGGQVVTGKTLPPPLDGPSFVAYLLPRAGT